MPEQEQVIVIQDILLLLAVHKRLKEFLQLIGVFQAPGIVSFEDRFQLGAGIHTAAVDFEQGAFAGKLLAVIAQFEFTAEGAH